MFLAFIRHKGLLCKLYIIFSLCTALRSHNKSKKACRCWTLAFQKHQTDIWSFVNLDVIISSFLPLSYPYFGSCLLNVVIIAYLLINTCHFWPHFRFLKNPKWDCSKKTTFLRSWLHNISYSSNPHGRPTFNHRKVCSLMHQCFSEKRRIHGSVP